MLGWQLTLLAIGSTDQNSPAPAKIDNLVFERFLAVPTIAGGDTAISGNLLALVDTEKRYIIWAIAKLSCAVHSTHSDPAG